MLILKDIKKDYGSSENIVHALKGVSINFRDNEFVSILGQSGCGKTTLLNIIGGLDKYTSGDLVIDGISTKEYKDKDWDYYRNSTIGFVFQSYNLIPHLNVLENVEIALTLTGISAKERKERAKEALIQMGLESELKKRPNQLSGGQMQRVAIARALVNNPRIILADEPTGALDSETSVQIMDILKEISKDRLIIMVTHNPSLAEKYSTRIINLMDGEVVSDSTPFNPSEQEVKVSGEKAQELKRLEREKSKKKNKTSMGFFTAIKLSFKNLITKKGRTFMTSFAGSIGIVGVALVLAISNGFTGYINKLQSDTLSGYPLSIGLVSADMESVSQMMSQGGLKVDAGEFNDKQLGVVDTTTIMADFSNYNFISPDYIDYIKEFENEDKQRKENDRLTNEIQYSYSSALNIVTKKNDNTYAKVNNTLTTNALTGATSSLFFEGLSNHEFVLDQYEVIHGSYPTNKNEVMLVVPKSNIMSLSTLINLGFDLSQKDDGKYNPIDFSSIVGENGKTYKVVTHDDYYIANKTGETITSFTKSSDYEKMYNSANSIELKISGIMRIKEGSSLELYDSGIMYLPELTTYFSEISQQSEIVKAQRANSNIFFEPFKVNVTGISNLPPFSYPAMLKAFIKQNYDVELTNDQLIEYGLQALGASSIPNCINIYPKSFDAKDEICAYLDAWNKSDKGKLNEISYTDATSMLSSTMGQMIDIISYVLVAFASISLVVSSIMIGIITYVSVIERTKEIGVLRAIGARKKDISRVFNAETILIGFTAGLIGVAVSYSLCPIINAIIHNLAGETILANFAVLNPLHAIGLIAISMLLTLISGLFPSSIAAKKDPVVALRTE